MPYPGNYRIANHTRINDGTSSDLSQSLAQHPGWVMGIEAFSNSSVAVGFLFLFDTAVAVTTAMTPFWQGVVPFSLSAGSSISAGGAGFMAGFWDSGIPFSSGLGYALSAGSTPATLSTLGASLFRVNLHYATSSCL